VNVSTVVVNENEPYSTDGKLGGEMYCIKSTEKLSKVCASATDAGCVCCACGMYMMVWADCRPKDDGRDQWLSGSIAALLASRYSISFFPYSIPWKPLIPHVG
jgi:hypothetical protein